MSSHNFNQQRQNAIEQLREMNRRSHASPQAESQTPTPPPKNPSFLEGLGIPFLSNLKTDGDLTLILGILLLLLSEKADKRLLFALIYILL